MSQYNPFPFQRLPPEIREQIWHEALWQEATQRIILTHGRQLHPAHGRCVLPTASLISPMLLANRESRLCAQRTFPVRMPVYRRVAVDNGDRRGRGDDEAPDLPIVGRVYLRPETDIFAATMRREDFHNGVGRYSTPACRVPWTMHTGFLDPRAVLPLVRNALVFELPPWGDRMPAWPWRADPQGGVMPRGFVEGLPMFPNVRRLIVADLTSPLVGASERRRIRDFLCLASALGGEGIFAKFEASLWIAHRGETVPLPWTRSWWDANSWKGDEYYASP